MKLFKVSAETAGQCEEGHPRHKIGWRITEEDGTWRENSNTPELDKLTTDEIRNLFQCFVIGTQAMIDWHGHILGEIGK